MPQAYQLHDAQYLQIGQSSSAVAGLSTTGFTAVPAKRIYTINLAMITVSVAETQTFWFSIGYGGIAYPITVPISFAVNPAAPGTNFPLVREGLEITLFPGMTLVANRAAATAGSTMTMFYTFIDTEMQFYVEVDQHKLLRRRAEALQESNPGFLRRAGLGRSSAFVREPRERPTRE